MRYGTSFDDVFAAFSQAGIPCTSLVFHGNSRLKQEGAPDAEHTTLCRRCASRQPLNEQYSAQAWSDRPLVAELFRDAIVSSGRRGTCADAALPLFAL